MSVATVKQTETSAEVPTTNPTFIPLSKAKLEIFKKQLHELANQKMEGVEFSNEGLKNTGDHVFGSHQEKGTDTQNATVASITRDLFDKDADQIAKALRRVENGKFGQCITCKGNIEEGRLESVPTAEICCGCSGLKRRV
jgi:DnaK suppressor protein